MIGSSFGDHYTFLADWLAGLLEEEIAAGRVSVLRDTTFDGRVMMIDWRKNFAVQLEVTVFDYPHVKELIEAAAAGKLGEDNILDKLAAIDTEDLN